MTTIQSESSVRANTIAPSTPATATLRTLSRHSRRLVHSFCPTSARTSNEAMRTAQSWTSSLNGSANCASTSIVTRATTGVVARTQTEDIPRGSHLPNGQMLDQPQGFMFLRDGSCIFLDTQLSISSPIRYGKTTAQDHLHLKINSHGIVIEDTREHLVIYIFGHGQPLHINRYTIHRFLLSALLRLIIIPQQNTVSLPLNPIFQGSAFSLSKRNTSLTARRSKASYRMISIPHKWTPSIRTSRYKKPHIQHTL